MEVRKPLIGELEICLELAQKNPIELPLFGELGKEESIDYLKDYLDKGIFLVLLEGDKIVGMVTGEYMLGKFIYVDALVVNKEHRGGGYGRLLMDSLRAEAAKKDIKKMFLLSPISNESSQKFYQKLGMSKGNLVQEYYFYD